MFKDLIIYFLYEQIGLEILKSAILSKNAIQTLEITQNLFLKKQKRNLVEKIEQIKALVEEGETLINALYSQGFLTTSTYQELSRINSMTKLEAEHIDQYIDFKTKERNFKTDANKSLISNYFTLILVIPVAIYNIYQFKPFIIKYMNDSIFYEFYYNIAYHPKTLGVLFLGSIVLFIIVFIQFSISFIVTKKLEQYSFISLIKILREAGVNYLRIFTFLAQYKFPKKILNKIHNILDNLLVEEPSKALLPIVEDENTDTSLIFLSKINQGDDVSGWKFLQEKIYKKTELAIESLKPTFNAIIMITMLIIIAISIVPMLVGISQTLTNI